MSVGEEKILVFDADVLIHFIQAGCFSDLKRIYPKNSKIVLQKVYDELQVYKESKTMLDSAIYTFKFLTLMQFPSDIAMMKEFAHLTSPLMDLGKGESACLSYCKFTQIVVVSSNLKDVKEYCKRQKLELLTTLDLVNWAHENALWTTENCNQVIQLMLKKGARFPCKTIQEYQLQKKN